MPLWIFKGKFDNQYSNKYKMFCLISPSVAGSVFTSGEIFMQGTLQFNGKIYNSLSGVFSQLL